VQQQTIVVAKSHIYRLAARRSSRHLCPMCVVFPRRFATVVIRGIASPNLPNDQPLEPSGFCQKVAFSDHLRPALDLRRDSRLQDFRTRHGPQCVPKASGALSCIDGFFAPRLSFAENTAKLSRTKSAARSRTSQGMRPTPRRRSKTPSSSITTV